TGTEPALFPPAVMQWLQVDVRRPCCRRSTGSTRTTLLCSRSAALFDGRELAYFRADVFGIGPDQAIVGTLLHDVRRPAGEPRHNEDGREQRCRNAHEVVCRGMVEVSVREQLLFVPHDLFEALGNGVQIVLVVV